MIDIFLSYLEEKGFEMAVTQIKKELERDETHSVYFIVPEQFSAESERLLTKALNKKGLINIGVYSISSLTNLVLRKTGSRTPRVIDECGRSMIVNLIMENLKSDLKCFHHMSGKVSFNESLSGLIQEFRRANITANDLEEKRESQDESSYLSRKLEDLSKIYTEYEKYMEEDYVDREQLPLFASLVIREEHLFENSSFYFFGYDGFDMTDYALIESLAAVNAKLNFVFITDTVNPHPTDAYSGVEETVRIIREMAKDASITVRTRKNSERPDNRDIAFLSDHVFSSDLEKYRGNPGNIHVSKNVSVREEVERTAAQIVSLLNRKDVSYSDILVLPSDFEEYRDIISEVFRRYNINFFLDNTTQIVSTNILRGMIKILDIINENFRTSDIIALLKTGITDVSREDTEILENYCQEFAVKGSMWTRDFTFNNEEESYDLSRLNGVRAGFMKPIMDLKSNLEKKDSVRDITKAFYSFIRNYGIEEKTREYIDTFTKAEDYTNANKYAQIYNSVITALEQLHDFLGEEKVTLSQYTDTLKMGFSALKIGIIPSTIDSVNIAALSRSRNRATKYLFVLGLNDGKLPSSITGQGSILSESEKNELVEQGFRLRSTEEMRSCQEKYFLISLMLKTHDDIFLSYPAADLKGAELSPSSIIMRINDIFPDLETKSYSAESYEDQLMLVNNPDASFPHLIANRMKPSENEKINAMWEYAREKYAGKERGKTLLKLMERAENFTNEAALKDRALIKKLGGDDLYASITKLQTYAQCPFRFFVHYILHPEEKQESTITSPDLGTIFHAILEEYAKRIIDGKVDPKTVTENEINELARDISENEMAGYSAGKMGIVSNSEYFRKKIRISAAVALSNMTRDLKNGSFTISSTEKPFGKGKDRAIPLTFTTKKGNRVTLQGFIDRVDKYSDADGNYIKVIDYKTKLTDFDKFDLKKNYYGTKIQLPVYLMAEELDDEKSTPAGAMYFRILPSINPVDDSDSLIKAEESDRSNAPDGFVVDNDEIVRKLDSRGLKKVKKFESEEIELILKKTENLIKDMTDSIAEGEIAIAPYADSCNFCPYSGICSFDAGFKKNAYRKMSVPAGEVIKRIREEVTEDEMD